MLKKKKCNFQQQQSEKLPRERVEQTSPLNGSSVSAASALNRLSSNNGELTITTTHGPSNANVKASPSSVHSVKDDDDDLLNDSSSKYYNYFFFRLCFVDEQVVLNFFRYFFVNCRSTNDQRSDE